MAYIKNSRGSATNLRVPGMDRAIDIPESGVAQVRADEAEALIEHCPTIHEHDPDEGDD